MRGIEADPVQVRHPTLLGQHVLRKRWKNSPVSDVLAIEALQPSTVARIHQ
jgi:hypothetical protein